MAVLTVDDALLHLNDLWPGQPNNMLAFPPDLTQWSDTEDYPVGTKITKRDPDNEGDSTFIYLKLIKGSTDVDVAAKSPVGRDSDGDWYEVSNDGGDIVVDGPIAIALSALDYGVSFTTAGKTYKYGWFWCGGVCPTGLVKNSAGTKVLDGNYSFAAGEAVTLGNGLKLADVAGAACKFAAKAATDLNPAAAICYGTVTAS